MKQIRRNISDCLHLGNQKINYLSMGEGNQGWTIDKLKGKEGRGHSKKPEAAAAPAQETRRALKLLWHYPSLGLLG